MLHNSLQTLVHVNSFDFKRVKSHSQLDSFWGCPICLKKKPNTDKHVNVQHWQGGRHFFKLNKGQKIRKNRKKLSGPQRVLRLPLALCSSKGSASALGLVFCISFSWLHPLSVLQGSLMYFSWSVNFHIHLSPSPLWQLQYFHHWLLIWSLWMCLLNSALLNDQVYFIFSLLTVFPELNCF